MGGREGIQENKAKNVNEAGREALREPAALPAVSKKKWVSVLHMRTVICMEGTCWVTLNSDATSSDGRLRKQLGSKLLILRTWMALLMLRWCSTLTTFKDSKSSCRKDQNAGLLEQDDLLKEVSENSHKSGRASLLIDPEGLSLCSKPLFNSKTLFLVPIKIFSRTPIYQKTKINVVLTDTDFHLFLSQTFWDRLVGPLGSETHSLESTCWVMTNSDLLW